MVEGETQVLEPDKHQETSDNDGEVSDCVELPQTLPCFALFGQFHPDSGRQRDKNMLAQTVDEQPGTMII